MSNYWPVRMFQENIGYLLACVLRILAERHGLNQRAVAELLDIPPQLLNDIKFGRKPMAQKVFDGFRELFDVQWDWIANEVKRILDQKDNIIKTGWDLPEFVGIENESIRRTRILLAEVDQIPLDRLPPLRGHERPPRVGAGMVLPILSRPTAEEPVKSINFTGEKSYIPNQAAMIARKSKNPYLLRYQDKDPDNRFSINDLLLIVEPMPELWNSNVFVMKHRHDMVLFLARLAKSSEGKPEAYIPVHDGRKRLPASDCEQVGVVVAVVWSAV